MFYFQGLGLGLTENSNPSDSVVFLKKAVRESGAAPINDVIPLFFCPRYPDL
jgi:hypothetical protein